MIMLTTETHPTKKILDVYGLVSGSTIKCKHIGADIGSSFRNVVGGEMIAYKKMLDSSRDVAITRMIEQAESFGANAIVGVRFMSSAVVSGAAEMVAFGTAVKIED